MEGKDMGILEAIEAAMKAETEAKNFYLGAVEKASSAQGKDMLKQLAAFEESHFKALEKLKGSLADSGAFIIYGGTKFTPVPSGLPSTSAKAAETNLDDVLDVLNLAISAETKAAQTYKDLAEMTSDPNGKEMFQKLAEEETLHRRILSDEFYQLTNMGGEWAWGE